MVAERGKGGELVARASPPSPEALGLILRGFLAPVNGLVSPTARHERRLRRRARIALTGHARREAVSLRSARKLAESLRLTARDPRETKTTPTHYQDLCLLAGERKPQT